MSIYHSLYSLSDCNLSDSATVPPILIKRVGQVGEKPQIPKLSTNEFSHSIMNAKNDSNSQPTCPTPQGKDIDIKVDHKHGLSVPQNKINRTNSDLANSELCKVSENAIIPPPAPPQQTQQALNLLHAASQLIELRVVMPDNKWWSGLYDDREKLIATVESLNQIEAIAIYWTINSIASALADRVTNLLGPVKRGACISNNDIERIKWLFLDLDNKGSREATLSLANQIKTYLKSKGWPDPHLISSGTGYYLFYPVDLPSNQAPLIKRVVYSLANQFDTDKAIVDKKCVNPGRIARIPGTYNRKDTATLCRFIEVA